VGGIPHEGLIMIAELMACNAAFAVIKETINNGGVNGSGNQSAIRSYSNLFNAWGTDLTFWTTGGAGNGMFERMRINSSGNVGIGTSSPTRLLSISGGDTELNSNVFYFDSGNAFMQSPSGTANLVFGTNATERMRIDSDGAVTGMLLGNYRERVYSIGAVSGTLALDAADGPIQDITLTGTIRQVMLVFRATNNPNPVVTFSTPTQQATDAAPANQTIPAGAPSVQSVYIGVYGKTSLITPTRGFTQTNFTFTENSRVGTSGVYAIHTIRNVGVNSIAQAPVTLSMTDAGTNTLQGFRMDIS
jgi:hypothetical protein